MYSTGCIVVRTQGLAVILNRILGTIVNAAYGIALHVTSAIHFVAQSVTNAINPQIMKAEGGGERQRMLSLAERASKYASLLIAMVAIPIIAEMDAILQWWLTEVPEQTTMFCRFVLAASICDQLTIGLGCANQAIGKIRTYSLIINTIKVLTLPAAYCCLRLNFPVYTVMWCYLGFECLCAVARLPFLKITAGLSIWHFIRHVFLPIIFPSIVMILSSWTFTYFVDMPYRFIFTIILTCVFGALAVYFTALTKEEQTTAKNIITNIKKHNK